MSDYMDGVRGVLDGHGARSCECGTDLAVTLAPAIAKIRADAKVEALRTFADEIRDMPGDTTPRHTIELMARIRADNQEAPNASNT